MSKCQFLRNLELDFFVTLVKLRLFFKTTALKPLSSLHVNRYVTTAFLQNSTDTRTFYWENSARMAQHKKLTNSITC